MGRIASASTIYANAYLSEKGRAYLFNKGNIRFDKNGNDLFEVLAFGLGDPDVNYLTNQRLISGDIPDITGKSEGTIKATADYTQSSLVYYSVDAMAFVDPQYSTNIVGNILVLNTDAGMPLNSNTDVPPVPQIAYLQNPSSSVTDGGFGVPGGDIATDVAVLTNTSLNNVSLGGGIVSPNVSLDGGTVSLNPNSSRDSSGVSIG